MSAILSRNRRKPSDYPSLAFHLIRLGQLLSALIVSIVLIFFVHQLHLEHYYIPWTFLLLLTVSLLTLCFLFTTGTLHFFGSLNARQNFWANSVLTILWILGLSLLTWNLTGSGTLGHRCVKATWHNEDGIMVCRLYKALTAFTVTGTFATILALLLDVRVERQSMARGKYNHMLDIKGPANLRSSSPFGGQSEGGEVPAINVRAPSSDAQRPYKVQRPIEARNFGYAQPEEQTSYGGGGGGGGDLGYESGREHAW